MLEIVGLIVFFSLEIMKFIPNLFSILHALIHLLLSVILCWFLRKDKL